MRTKTYEMTTGHKFVTEYTMLGEVKGEVQMFLRWAGHEFTVRDFDGNYTARFAWIKNMTTGKVYKKRFGMHGSVLDK